MNTIPQTDSELSSDLLIKRERFLGIFRSLSDAVIAFSGGVDSTVVAKAAFLELADRCVAVTADSPSVARAELEEAQWLAQQIGIRHIVIRTEEFQNPDYLKNDGSRCYYCKSELYSKIDHLLPELGMSVLCSGANLDDLGDYRPGLLAASEHRVRHPLQEAELSKAEVRAIARSWNLPVWDKPASPCLSSRLAPGLAVTSERIQRIEQAELVLRSLGLRICRVRYHEGELARIEVPLEELPHITRIECRELITRQFKRLGFKFVTLDLEGFRTGSLNELVSLEVRGKYPSVSTV